MNEPNIFDELVNRKADAELKQKIDSAFRAFDTEIASLCRSHDTELPQSMVEFQRQQLGLKQDIFVAAKDFARVLVAESFVRKLTEE